MNGLLTYDMFDVSRSSKEARRFAKMQSIYHRGQDLSWDGREVLMDALTRHGRVQLSERKKRALGKVLGPILWGELAAWRIALQIADGVPDLEPKMAATAQAHDEARHFYVMHDYMEAVLGEFPRSLPPATERLLRGVLEADTLAKKVLGMQLQVETVALTIFQCLREARICPVLSELLIRFEKDEARHVGLGVQLLPSLMKQMSVSERIAFSAYSFRVLVWSLASMRALEGDLRELGLDPRAMLLLGRSKQMLAFEQLWEQAPGARSVVADHVRHVFEAIGEGMFPDEHSAHNPHARAHKILRTLRYGSERVTTTLQPEQVA